VSDQERIELINKLGKVCSRQRLLPKSMHIPDCSNKSSEVECYGGNADVSTSVYKGQKVAVKVLRVYTSDNFDMILSVSVQSVHVTPGLNETFTEILPGGGDMEAPQTSKHPPTPRCDLRRISICYGLGVDGEREHC